MFGKKKETGTKPFVFDKTISKSVKLNAGGGLTSPNERKVIKVGKHSVLIERAAKLDKYGNPVQYATVIKPDGSLGKTCRTNGAVTLAVKDALKSCGIEIKYSKPLTRMVQSEPKVTAPKKPAAITKKTTARGKARK